MASNGLNTTRWKKITRAVLRNSRVCHLCGHYGADGADHIEPRSIAPERIYDMSNLKPVHNSPCRECSELAGRPVRCNNIRQDRSVEYAKKRIQEYTSGKKAPVPGNRDTVYTKGEKNAPADAPKNTDREEFW